MTRPTDHDVVVLGSGLFGSMIAACLARAGRSVLVIDAGKHPRFAVGESTIPFTSTMLRLIASRYDVPEIAELSTFRSVQDRVSRNCGIKRNFGFVYHAPSERPRRGQANQFTISKLTHTENHFFRQDTDLWMLSVAERYGAEVRQETRVHDVELADDAVTLRMPDGTLERTRYLVDASGFRSPLATELNLREEPTRLRTHSRSIFTHMRGVRPFDELSDLGPATPWHSGTLHHIFPGGWMWVIPFDNHDGAPSDLCSVGVSVDPRMHPRREDVEPAEEFAELTAAMPAVVPQFADAEAVRPWVSTGRLQYSSTRTVGPRWCLTSHAAGFIDALFSRGMENSTEIVHALVWRILDALQEDDFDPERFAPVEELEQGLLEFNDRLVSGAYTSFGSWDMWNAWFRVWQSSQVLSTLEVSRAYARFSASGDTTALEHLARLEPRGSIPEHEPLHRFLADADAAAEAVRAGSLTHDEAATRIFADLRRVSFLPPALKLDDPAHQWFGVGVLDALKMVLWAKTRAPAPVGDTVFEGFTLMSALRARNFVADRAGLRSGPQRERATAAAPRTTT